MQGQAVRSTQQVADDFSSIEHGHTRAITYEDSSEHVGHHSPTSKNVALIALLLSLRSFMKRELNFKRIAIRLLSAVLKSAVAAIAASLIWHKLKKRKNTTSPSKVAVVGSGIAGAGAAWTMNKSGIDVTVYEKKPKPGGNAKCMNWNVDGRKVDTGLAVFAWPDELFHNYNALIEELQVETEFHDMKFYVTEKDEVAGTKLVFAHGKQNPSWVKEDLERWDELCRYIKSVNEWFSPSAYPSLYSMSWVNPLNLIPLKRLCQWWGVSQRFWDYVFVPVHTSTFLEVNMDSVPGSMGSLLNDIVPFSATPRMKTWKTNAYDTVVAMLQDIKVKTSCGVETVTFNADGSVCVTDEDGESRQFDAVVFACSAQAMNRILHGEGQPGENNIPPNNSNGLNSITSWLESFLLRQTLYTTDRDKTFERGIVHTQSAATIPAAHRDDVMREYCNYIEVKEPGDLENSFVISSWAPTAEEFPMLVTYNADKKLDGLDTEWVSTSREAHPCLTTWQMMSTTVLWPLLQGRRNAKCYFCGSAVLPGNGHDLSFLSGIVAATELGANYPFQKNKMAQQDFDRLRGMMLSAWA